MLSVHDGDASGVGGECISGNLKRQSPICRFPEILRQTILASLRRFSSAENPPPAEPPCYPPRPPENRPPIRKPAKKPKPTDLAFWVPGLAALLLFLPMIAPARADSAAPTSTADLLKMVQNRLRATRDDYQQMAEEALAAAIAAGARGVPDADALSAAIIIAGRPNFRGNQTQLETLVETAANMGAVFGESVPWAATELATAFDDPGREAERLQRRDIRGMSTSTADDINMLANSGDKAGAFDKLYRVLRTDTDGAVLTPALPMLPPRAPAQRNAVSAQQSEADGSCAHDEAHDPHFFQTFPDGIEECVATRMLPHPGPGKKR